MASRPRLVAKFPSAHNKWEISRIARRGGVGTSRSLLMFAPHDPMKSRCRHLLNLINAF
jgi:hypothetical protein